MELKGPRVGDGVTGRAGRRSRGAAARHPAQPREVTRRVVRRRGRPATGPATQAVHRLAGTLEMTRSVNEAPAPPSRARTPLCPGQPPPRGPQAGQAWAWRGRLRVTGTARCRPRGRPPGCAGPSRLDTAPGRSLPLASASRPRLPEAPRPGLGSGADLPANGARARACPSRSGLRLRGKVAFTQLGDTFH